MALTDPGPESAAEEGGGPSPAPVLAGRDLGLQLTLGVAAPGTDFSACRTGLISDLLLGCGEGDAAAFESLVDIFYSVVVAAAARHLPPGDVERAVRRTFLTIWRRSPLYRPGGATAVEWIVSQAVTAGTTPARTRL